MPCLLRQCFFAMALLAAASSAPAQEAASATDQTSHRFERNISRNVQVDYFLFLPRGYKAEETKRWPLLLFLHGAGERGTNLDLVKVHGPPKIVAQQPDFPFVTISPQCPFNSTWNNELLLALLDDVIAHHRIDTNRVYLTGLSMGGFGSWSLALANPERFAAVAPICGGGNALDVLLASKRKRVQTLPVWAFHGAKDPVVKLEESERMVAALRKIGAKEVELTVYPDAEHDSWTATYQNPKLYEWFLQHTRAEPPAAPVEAKP